MAAWHFSARSHAASISRDTHVHAALSCISFRTYTPLNISSWRNKLQQSASTSVRPAPRRHAADLPSHRASQGCYTNVRCSEGRRCAFAGFSAVSRAREGTSCFELQQRRRPRIIVQLPSLQFLVEHIATVKLQTIVWTPVLRAFVCSPDVPVRSDAPVSGWLR